jgi:hypothetical protein
MSALDLLKSLMDGEHPHSLCAVAGPRLTRHASANPVRAFGLETRITYGPAGPYLM